MADLNTRFDRLLAAMTGSSWEKPVSQFVKRSLSTMPTIVTKLKFAQILRKMLRART